jgi:hypothetical protein
MGDQIHPFARKIGRIIKLRANRRTILSELKNARGMYDAIRTSYCNNNDQRLVNSFALAASFICGRNGDVWLYPLQEILDYATEHKIPMLLDSNKLFYRSTIIYQKYLTLEAFARFRDYVAISASDTASTRLRRELYWAINQLKHTNEKMFGQLMDIWIDFNRPIDKLDAELFEPAGRLLRFDQMIKFLALYQKKSDKLPDNYYKELVLNSLENRDHRVFELVEHQFGERSDFLYRGRAFDSKKSNPRSLLQLIRIHFKNGTSSYFTFFNPRSSDCPLTIALAWLGAFEDPEIDWSLVYDKDDFAAVKHIAKHHEDALEYLEDQLPKVLIDLSLKYVV